MKKCKICDTQFKGKLCPNCAHPSNYDNENISKILAKISLGIEIFRWVLKTFKISYLDKFTVKMFLIAFILAIISIIIHRNTLSKIALTIEIIQIILFIMFIGFILIALTIYD